jgi:hypothetical protein
MVLDSFVDKERWMREKLAIYLLTLGISVGGQWAQADGRKMIDAAGWRNGGGTGERERGVRPK